MPDFCHLHLHSEMSLLDGMSRVAEIPGRVRELGMRHVALTDHGVLYGAVDFWKACRAEGVHPVLGVEGYLAQRTRFDREPHRDDAPYHILLLAEDDTGWRNLMRLVSLASLEGFYYRPRLDRELLETYREGLITTTGCLSAEIPQLIRAGRLDEAETAFRWYLERFGRQHFFVELMDHGLHEERVVGRALMDLARRYDVQAIVTQDAHYLRREDAAAHDVLLAIQTGKGVSDPGRLRYPNDTFYVTSPEEMEARFPGYEDALRRTVEIAERTSVSFRFGQVLLPEVHLRPGESAEEGLTRLCRERLPSRYGPNPPPAVTERLEYELSVIKAMGFAAYFLIVFDFVDFARRRGIAVGPGRGSAAGSLVAYVLGITDVDPLRYGLLFERFLNPERVTMPDMDIDFEDVRRGEVIQYVTERYGQERVSQIITFGTLAARAAIRDVARALELPYQEADRLAKLVPAELGITLERALSGSETLRGLYESREEVRRVIDVARRLEGMPRHASVHAAGVLIAPRPLLDVVPLQRMPDGTVVTQFPMGTLEELGLLKMDFLGLRTLTIIEGTKALVREAGGVVPERAELPLDDGPTYRLLQEADTLGVFQLESQGMRDMLRELRPETVEDVMAAVSLYRPGPMENIPLFVTAKHSGAVRYLHEDLAPILAPTYGVMVYQEQIMQVAHRMAGYSLGEADLLRRAMAKKKADVLAAERERFVAGVEGRGYPRALGEELFDLIFKFANYGFNKAHGAAYGLLAYETAYLKAHHPAEYLAATISSLQDTERIALYLQDGRRHGVRALPPDVNHSRAGASVEDGAVRLGLALVKGVGQEAAESVVRARAAGPFRSFPDFVRRLDGLNRRTVEALVKAGAFDGLHPRPLLLAQWERLWQESRRAAAASQQMALIAADEVEPTLEPEPSARESEVLAGEREALGFYLTAHPVDAHEERLRAAGARLPGDLDDVPDEADVTLAGVLTAERRVRTRKGEEMAFLVLSDRVRDVEVVVFPRLFRQSRGLLQADAPLIVRGRLERGLEGELKCVAEALLPGWQAPELHLTVRGDVDRERLTRLLRAFPGPSPVVFLLPDGPRPGGQSWRVDAENPLLLEGLEELLGRDAVAVHRIGA